jgi:hypothetical protein
MNDKKLLQFSRQKKQLHLAKPRWNALSPTRCQIKRGFAAKFQIMDAGCSVKP